MASLLSLIHALWPQGLTTWTASPEPALCVQLVWEMDTEWEERKVSELISSTPASPSPQLQLQTVDNLAYFPPSHDS